MRLTLPLLGSSSTYQSTGRPVAVRYTQGNWEGELGLDLVSVPEGPNGTAVINLAAILSSEGFFLPDINWQGILGLAYPLLARVSRLNLAAHSFALSRKRHTLHTGLKAEKVDASTSRLSTAGLVRHALL